MGKCKNFLIPQGELVPAPFVESPQVVPFWLYMQAASLAKPWNFNEKSGVTVEISIKQAGDGDHGAVGGIMEAAKPVSGCFGGDQLYFPFKCNIFVYTYCYQTLLFFFYDTDLR